MISRIEILKNPAYRTLLISNALWWYTLSSQTIVVGWLVLELTDSALAVSLMSFWRRASQLAIGFFAGPLVDRFGSRRTMLQTQYGVLAVWLVIIGLLWIGQILPWHLGLATFLIGLSWTINLPARAVLVPNLVGRSSTVEAMIVESFLIGLIGIFSPYITGWQIAVFGPIGVYVWLAILVGFNLWLIQRLFKQAPSEHQAQSRQSVWTSIREGVQYIRHSPVLLGVTLVSIILNILIFPAMALFPVFARDILDQGPVGLGLMGAASGVGLFVGLYLVHRLRRWLSEGWIFVGGALLECLAFLIFAYSVNFWLSCFMLLLTGLGQAGFSTMRASLLLTESSEDMRSRTTSVVALTQGIGLPGELITGGLADTIGAPPTVGLQAGLAAVGTGVVAMSLPGLRKSSSAERVG